MQPGYGSQRTVGSFLILPRPFYHCFSSPSPRPGRSPRIGTSVIVIGRKYTWYAGCGLIPTIRLAAATVIQPPFTPISARSKSSVRCLEAQPGADLRVGPRYVSVLATFFLHGIVLAGVSASLSVGQERTLPLHARGGDVK